MSTIDRRSALRSLILLGTAAACGVTGRSSAAGAASGPGRTNSGAGAPGTTEPGSARPAAAAQPARPPALDARLVNQFVLVAHAKLDVVTDMLATHPTLVNATWDWGGGDFESALGAAAHMGRADIADHLLANGARIDLFCAAMLGKLEMVRAALRDTPGLVHVRGPHGISLLRHAEAGNQRAMIDLLKQYGAV